MCNSGPCKIWGLCVSFKWAFSPEVKKKMPLQKSSASVSVLLVLHISCSLRLSFTGASQAPHTKLYLFSWYTTTCWTLRSGQQQKDQCLQRFPFVIIIIKGQTYPALLNASYGTVHISLPVRRIYSLWTWFVLNNPFCKQFSRTYKRKILRKKHLHASHKLNQAKNTS